MSSTRYETTRYLLGYAQKCLAINNLLCKGRINMRKVLAAIVAAMFAVVTTGAFAAAHTGSAPMKDEQKAQAKKSDKAKKPAKSRKSSKSKKPAKQ